MPMSAHGLWADIPGMGWVKTFLFHVWALPSLMFLLVELGQQSSQGECWGTVRVEPGRSLEGSENGWALPRQPESCHAKPWHCTAASHHPSPQHCDAEGARSAAHPDPATAPARLRTPVSACSASSCQPEP